MVNLWCVQSRPSDVSSSDASCVCAFAKKKPAKIKKNKEKKDILMLETWNRSPPLYIKEEPESRIVSPNARRKRNVASIERSLCVISLLYFSGDAREGGLRFFLFIRRHAFRNLGHYNDCFFACHSVNKPCREGGRSNTCIIPQLNWTLMVRTLWFSTAMLI